ncbi:hypothetical protein FRC05_003154 [Tulasnella sp. 425]|nr:hypothetical protein FRC05_003154 [Tulasnella sp. 425]
MRSGLPLCPCSAKAHLPHKTTAWARPKAVKICFPFPPPICFKGSETTYAFTSVVVEVVMDSDGGLNTPPSSRASAHKCTIFSKAFSRHTDLRRHKDAVHLKIRNFKCADCGKSFAQKIGLQTHMNSQYVWLYHFSFTSFNNVGVSKAPAPRRTNVRSNVDTHPSATRLVGAVTSTKNTLLLGSNVQKATEGELTFYFRIHIRRRQLQTQDALKSHIFHCHRAKAFTYTDEQLLNKMPLARFNEVFLRPAIELVKARRPAEGYVSDEDYEKPRIGVR